MTDDPCSDCPPAGYPTDVTRCTPCPRRAYERLVEAAAAYREIMQTELWTRESIDERKTLAAEVLEAAQALPAPESDQ